ncbi:MAG: hypothetical protein WB949_14515 [Candidatus Acidiferrales bacterium]
MKILHRISIVFIAIPLLVMLWSSRWYILYTVPPGRSDMHFEPEGLNHEAGFARLALAVIGLLILFIPYRKGERWAFAALAVLTVFYVLPAFFFFLPHLESSIPAVRNLPRPPALGIAQVYYETKFFTALVLAGFAMAVPQFIRGTRGSRPEER